MQTADTNVADTVTPSPCNSCRALRAPAPGGEDGLDRADRLPGVAHEEGHVAELGHAGQEPHVLHETVTAELGTFGIFYFFQ